MDISLIFINWSTLQNEQKLSFRLTTTALIDKSSSKNIFTNDSNCYNENLKEVIHAREPIIEKMFLHFNTDDLHENENKGKMVVWFAGLSSPLKYSEYELDFTGLINGKSNTVQIKTIEENLIFKEVQEKNGLTKEAIIKTLLENRWY